MSRRVSSRVVCIVMSCCDSAMYLFIVCMLWLISSPMFYNMLINCSSFSFSVLFDAGGSSIIRSISEYGNNWSWL